MRRRNVIIIYVGLSILLFIRVNRVNRKINRRDLYGDARDVDETISNLKVEDLDTGSGVDVHSHHLTDSRVLKFRPNDLLTGGKRIHYIAGLKNPCFVVNGSSAVSSRFHCVPQFYLAGTEKCGSSDLTTALSKHQHIYRPSCNTETHWFDSAITWSHRKYGHTIQGYSYVYNNNTAYKANGTAEIFQCLQKMDNPDKCPYILGDYTPRYIAFGNAWEKISGNENLDEPHHLIPHMIYALNPLSKIIFIIRDPVKRLFSSYKYFMDQPERIQSCNITDKPQDFHDRVKTQIDVWNTCLKFNIPFRSCLYGNPAKLTQVYPFYPHDCLWMWHHHNPTQLKTGMYYYYIMEWLKVFDKQNILVLKLEDYSKDRIGHMLRYILPFLGMDSFNHDALKQFTKWEQRGAVVNSKASDFKMFESTRNLLKDFYQIYNEKLDTFLSRYNSTPFSLYS